jgi:hypothetical protein
MSWDHHDKREVTTVDSLARDFEQSLEMGDRLRGCHRLLSSGCTRFDGGSYAMHR